MHLKVKNFMEPDLMDQNTTDHNLNYRSILWWKPVLLLFEH